MFIIAAPGSSEIQTTLKTILQEEPLERLMASDHVTFPADMPVYEMVETCFYRFHHKVFPVARDGTLLGCVSLDGVGRIAPEERARRTAEDNLARDSAARTIGLDTSVLNALDLTRKHNTSRLMVTENRTLRGMLAMRDFMNYVTIRRELGDRHRKA